MALIWLVLCLSVYGGAHCLDYSNEAGLMQSNIESQPPQYPNYIIQPNGDHQMLISDTNEMFQNDLMTPDKAVDYDSSPEYEAVDETEPVYPSRKKRSTKLTEVQNKTSKEDKTNRNKRNTPIQTIEDDHLFYLNPEDQNWNFSPFFYQALDRLSNQYHRQDAALPDVHELDPDASPLQDKRNFSPWGGKRSESDAKPGNGKFIRYTWSWKRSPTRHVKFASWGGKRSRSVFLKPWTNNAELAKRSSRSIGTSEDRFYPKSGISESVYLKRLNMKKARFSSWGGKRSEDQYPFIAWRQLKPEYFVQDNWKKDGKNRFKFSAWGGKRSDSVGFAIDPSTDMPKPSLSNHQTVSSNYLQN